MSEIVSETGMSHRPHFKAHKCLAICRLQIEAGARGFCAATVGEAEVLSSLDVSILITSIISSDTNLVRAVELQAQHGSLTLVVDSVKVAQRMNAVFSARECEVDVLLDIDTGRHRSGCTSVAQARSLAQAIGSMPSLKLQGLQVYAGHLSHMRDPHERQQAHQAFQHLVEDYRHGLVDVLPASPLITGGSTGSLAFEIESPVLNELQCGSYALMDVEYLSMDYSPQTKEWPFRAALQVQASILSNQWPTHAVADAGDKRFASKYGFDPHVVRLPSGFEPDSVSYRPQSDEHGRLDFTGSCPPPVGARIECTVPHCDPTINLFDTVYLVNADRVVDVWTVDARGA